MPEIILTYADVAGRAEMVRLALAYADIPFTDKRINMEDWPKMKESAPYGAVPIISIDGKVYAQSHAMLRYCGKLAGLYPEDPLEALLVDEIIDTIIDLNSCILRYKGDDDEVLRADREKLVAEEFPKYLGGIESQIEKLGGKEFISKDGMSIADLAIATSILFLKTDYIKYVSEESLEPYKRLNEITQKIMNEPKFVAWWKDHPFKE